MKSVTPIEKVKKVYKPSAEKLLRYSRDKAYGLWFMGKASDLIGQIESDFEYYVEVTEIKKKISSDKVAASVYLTLRERIDKLSTTQDCGHS